MGTRNEEPVLLGARVQALARCAVGVTIRREICPGSDCLFADGIFARVGHSPGRPWQTVAAGGWFCDVRGCVWQAGLLAGQSALATGRKGSSARGLVAVHEEISQQ